MADAEAVTIRRAESVYVYMYVYIHILCRARGLATANCGTSSTTIGCDAIGLLSSVCVFLRVDLFWLRTMRGGVSCVVSCASLSAVQRQIKYVIETHPYEHHALRSRRARVTTRDAHLAFTR